MPDAPGIVLTAFAATLLAARLLLSPVAGRLALAHPNERSLHRQPVPASGGLAIALGVGVGWTLLGEASLWPLGGLALLLCALSFVDDLRGLPAWLRLLLHGLAAAALIGFMAPDLPMAWQIVLGAAVIWMTNLYNFMDGADGLAGGMAVAGFGAYALAAGMAGDAGLAGACWVIAAAAAAFLVYNFHPARLFMGDAGSIPLGFLAAGLGVLGWQRGDWPAWLPPLVFSPFLADASVTLVKRGLRREPVWRAHRQHYYQRLVRLGLGHGGLAALEYGHMLGAALLALWLVRHPAWAGMLLPAWLTGLALAMYGVDRLWAQRKGEG